MTVLRKPLHHWPVAIVRRILSAALSGAGVERTIGLCSGCFTPIRERDRSERHQGVLYHRSCLWYERQDESGRPDRNRAGRNSEQGPPRPHTREEVED